uniref:Uncharacterized protein n=1 Tax=Babesia bovis TaxID=5865 RepID=S6B1W8_BABBO|nr:hypothetical protein [Babesia bovis]
MNRPIIWENGFSRMSLDITNPRGSTQLQLILKIVSVFVRILNICIPSTCNRSSRTTLEGIGSSVLE